MKRRVAILFDNFGPYHLARLQAVSADFDLLAVEFGVSSAEYAWNQVRSAGLGRVAINETGESRVMSAKEFAMRLKTVLTDFKPEVVFVPGWGSREALLALQWCLKNHVPSVMMSDSTYWDEKRTPLKEWVKRLVLKSCSAAFVAGTPHAEYLVKLGFQRECISMGYDVVDNDFFENRVKEIKNSEIRIQKSGKETVSCSYFLASARFIEKKNLFRLIRAYAMYREKAKPSTLDPRPSTRQQLWGLILLGDGCLRPNLCHLISVLGLEGCVHLPGFKNYEDLPAYYASAGAFIHASTTDQWGLVVNEAMASGLPVLVSNRCGCAFDLVQEGVNGWTFNPNDSEQLAAFMGKISAPFFPRLEYGFASQRIILNWGLKRFVQGMEAAIDSAMAVGAKSPSFLFDIIISSKNNLKRK